MTVAQGRAAQGRTAHGSRSAPPKTAAKKWPETRAEARPDPTVVLIILSSDHPICISSLRMRQSMAGWLSQTEIETLEHRK